METPESNPLANSSLRLNSLPNARRSLAKIIRMYSRGLITSAMFRDLVYGLSHLIGAFKTEKSLEIEDRLARIEEALEGAEAYGAVRSVFR